MTPQEEIVALRAENARLLRQISRLKTKAKGAYALIGRADHAARMAEGWRDLAIKRRPK